MEEMPKRIQRKRTKGWTMPANTIYVGRPTKWGNPFKLEHGKILVKYPNSDFRFFCAGDEATLLNLFKSVVTGTLTEKSFPLLDWRIQYLKYWSNHFATLKPSRLAGKNLACWCSLEKGCHADVLISLANEQ